MTAKPPQIVPASLGPRSRNLQGMAFERLTVVIFAGYNRQGAHWVCFCSCGETRIVSANALLVGDAIACATCGHAIRVEKLAKALVSKDGLSAFRQLVFRYKKSAKRRGISYELSDDDCKSLFALPCTYCGCPPSHTFHIGNNYKKDRKFAGIGGVKPIIYNGIDRIDSKLGYVQGNVTTCCRVCNQAKMDMSVGRFLAWAQRVAAHQNRQACAA